MLNAFVSAFRTPDLRRKLLFTLGIIALLRLGSVLPTPGVSYPNVSACVEQAGNDGIYGLINLFSGGALLQLSVFALGIMPYITASIILQLLVVVIPRLEALKKEGASGQAKITEYTRYLTLVLAAYEVTAGLLLDRYGVVTRGSVQSEGVPGGVARSTVSSGGSPATAVPGAVTASSPVRGAGIGTDRRAVTRTGVTRTRSEPTSRTSPTRSRYTRSGRTAEDGPTSSSTRPGVTVRRRSRPVQAVRSAWTVKASCAR